MKLMVLGGGGREHTIVKKLKENPNVEVIYALPGNGGMAQDAECINIKATDIVGVTDFARSHKIDYAIVAPDDPLCLGMVDQLAEKGIPAFGPEKKAAIIEGSKVFSKNLMKKYNIPTADYAMFDRITKALAYMETATYPLVIKADGLALGKGVIICANKEEGLHTVKAMMEDGLFGLSGSRIVVEEFLEGPEVSVLCFTDGNVIKPMVSSMDHKRALDNDQGLNTGGMGAIAPNPFYTKAIAGQCMEEIFLPTIRAMSEEGRTFKGCLYFGLMLTKNGPKVIEYNCRFGDPETQVVLPLLKSDLLTIMQATTNGTLAETEVTFDDGAACCVVMASGGYPQSYTTDYTIQGLKNAEATACVFHAGTKLGNNGDVLTSGGRVLGVTAVADTLQSAVIKAYDAADKIHFQGAHMRRDIGGKALGESK